mmetsp:Transcript_47733/g.110644  ORF Transcript_47733/g.110644 Transcript_47733/m.110644 type:complete len:266 (-) Transcript_47733:215-1012(-)
MADDGHLLRLVVRGRMRAQPLHEGQQYLVDVGGGGKPAAMLEEERERRHVVLDGEDLRDAVHQVLLRDGVLAVDHLLEDGGQHRLGVNLERHPLERREADEVGADKDAQLRALALAPLALPHGPLVLHAHPQLVHLAEVGEDERDGVAHGAAGAFVHRAHVGQLVLGGLRKVVAQEEAAHRLLHASAHLDQIFQHVLRCRLLARDVHGPHSDEEVEAGEHVAGVLHKLVDVLHPLAGLLLAREVVLEVPQLIRYCHVEFVVALWP